MIDYHKAKAVVAEMYENGLENDIQHLPDMSAKDVALDMVAYSDAVSEIFDSENIAEMYLLETIIKDIRNE